METNNHDQQNTVTLQVPSKEAIAAKRPFIPFSFGAAIVLFFFTFCDLKCTNGQHLASIKGINLVTGTSIDKPSVSGNSFFGMSNVSDEPEKQSVKPNFWAILAFFSAIGGLFVFFKRHPKEDFLGTIAGGVGVVSLFFLWLKLSAHSAQLAATQLYLIIRPAFWFTILAFIVAGGISYLRYRLPVGNVENSVEADSGLVQEGSQST